MQRADRVRALAGAVAFLLCACGVDSRAVLAHHANGVLASEARETPNRDGGWVKDGPFRSWHANGQRKSEGDYVDGREHGVWSYWFESGATLAEGRYTGGVRSGAWSRRHPNGEFESRGAYLFGEKEGVWVYRRADGSLDEELSGVYEADVRIGSYVIDGALTRSASDGTVLERTQLADQLPHGESSTFFADGSPRWTGAFEKGRKTGPWTYWNRDGSIDRERSGEYDGRRRVSPKSP